METEKACKVTLFVTVLVMTLSFAVTPVTSTSEPAALFCEQACWEQDVLAQSCENDNNCDSDTMTDEEYLACARPCWVESSACQRMCRQRFVRVLDQCGPLCRNSTQETCILSCFLDRMLNYMARHRQRNNGRLSPSENATSTDDAQASP